MNFFKNLSFLLLRILVKRSGAMPLKSLMRPNKTKTRALVPVKSILVYLCYLGVHTVHSPSLGNFQTNISYLEKKYFEDNLASADSLRKFITENSIPLYIVRVWERILSEIFSWWESISAVRTRFSVRLSDCLSSRWSQASLCTVHSPQCTLHLLPG